MNALAAVDDEQQSSVARQASADEVTEQCVRHSRVFGAAFAQAQDVFRAIGGDAQSDEDTVLVKDDAVDEHHAEVQSAERPSEPPPDGLCRQRDEPPRHAALGDGTFLLPRRQVI